MNSCSIDGCARQRKHREFCEKHYRRLRSRGELPVITRQERFFAKVNVTETCWLWTGAISRGYGRFSFSKGKVGLAHRYAYQLLVGPIPDGLDLDHLCRVTNCVNPAHLEPVTDRVNILRGVSPFANRARQTHCKRGHEFTPENTYRRPDRPNTRACRICGREAKARERASA